MSVYVHRDSGLLEPFEVPELTMEASIDRSMEIDGALLVPRQPEYLPTFAGMVQALSGLPVPWEWISPPIPWEPMISGLPEL